MAKPKEIQAVGRPPQFKSPDELEEKINLYINTPPTKTHTTKDGDEFEVPSITITGLCWYLGFESRQSFYDYEKKPEFTYIIKRARLFIENDYEVQLKAAQCTGAIFALKNMGWSDKQEIVSTVTNNIMPVPTADSVESWEEQAQKQQGEMLGNA